MNFSPFSEDAPENELTDAYRAPKVELLPVANHIVLPVGDLSDALAKYGRPITVGMAHQYPGEAVDPSAVATTSLPTNAAVAVPMMVQPVVLLGINSGLSVAPSRLSSISPLGCPTAVVGELPALS